MGKGETEPTISHLLQVLRDSRSFKDKELREAVLSTVVSALDGENCSAILRAADDMACSPIRKWAPSMPRLSAGFSMC